MSAVCHDCGANLYDAGEYHPAAFCALVREGFDPWQVIRIVAGQLELGDPGERPPVITQMWAASSYSHPDHEEAV